MSKDLSARSCWRVRIPAHRIERTTLGGEPRDGNLYPPYELAEVDVLRFEDDRVAAALQAVREAHIDAGVPPWKPYMRVTVKLVKAERRRTRQRESGVAVQVLPRQRPRDGASAWA